MKGTTLRALGLNIGDVDERVLLDEGFDCSGVLAHPAARTPRQMMPTMCCFIVYLVVC